MKDRFIPSNQSVMTVNLHVFMIMRNGKYEDLSMKLLHSRHSWIKLKDCIDRDTGTASILPVCNVESGARAAFTQLRQAFTDDQGYATKSADFRSDSEPNSAKSKISTKSDLGQ